MTAAACTVNGCTQTATLDHDTHGPHCTPHAADIDRWSPHWHTIGEQTATVPLVNTPPADTNPRTQLLADAEQLVNGDRNADYGDPNQDFARTAAMWGPYLSGVAERKGITLPMNLLGAWDIAWMQVLLKASRSTTSPGKRDHYLDAAGYAACGWHCAGGNGG